MAKSDLSLNDFIGGWLVGNFEPSLFKRDDIEVGLKQLKRGFVDEAHFHKKSSEFNVLISGRLKLETGEEIEAGNFFIYKPNEVARCEALSDCMILVIRDGSDPNDKYEA